MDLRALPIFTIDSAETKDIDDAISLTKTPDGGFELGVHIADVSNYVKPGSELDNEAFNRHFRRLCRPGGAHAAQKGCPTASAA